VTAKSVTSACIGTDVNRLKFGDAATNSARRQAAQSPYRLV
jgi:hypothetical protein